MAELARLNKEEGITLMVITHDQKVADFASRVLTLVDGRMTELAGTGEAKR